MNELTPEEINVLLALADAGTKTLGNEVYRQGAGGLYQSAYTKLQERLKELVAPKPESKPNGHDSDLDRLRKENDDQRSWTAADAAQAQAAVDRFAG